MYTITFAEKFELSIGTYTGIYIVVKPYFQAKCNRLLLIVLVNAVTLWRSHPLAGCWGIQFSWFAPIQYLRDGSLLPIL